MAYDILVEIALDAETLRYSSRGVSTSSGYYEERLSSVRGLVRELSENGEVTPIQNCTIVLSDSDGAIRTIAAGTTLSRRAVTVKLLNLEDGSETTVFVGKIKSRSVDYESVSLDIRDNSYDILSSPIGITTNANIFPYLATTTKLMFVPIVFGTVSSTTYDSKGHIPAYLIDPAVGQTKYRYVAAQHPLKSITAVYRNGQLVSASDYTVTYANMTVDGATVRMTFIDFNHDKRKSNPDTEDVQITYDATGMTNDNLESGTLLTNPADILKALLKLRGVLVDGDFDSTLFTACQAAYTSASVTTRGAIVDNITWMDAIDKFAQSFNLQFFKTRSGSFGMVFDNAATSAAYEVLFQDSVNILSGSFNQDIQERDDEASSYEFSYASDFARGGYSSLFAYTDTTEETALGEDVRRQISYEFVPDINQCQIMSQIKLFQGRSSRIRVNFQCPPYPELELGNYIAVTHYSGESTDGLGFSEKVFRIRSLEYSFDGTDVVQSIEALDHPGLSIGSPADSEPPREDVVPDPVPNSIESNVVWTLTDYNTVTWSACSVYVYQDGAAGTFSILTGNTGNMAAITYVYLDLDVSVTAFQTTTTYATCVGPRKFHLATCMQARRTSAKAHIKAKVGTVNTGSYTVPGSIGPDEIPANTIEADHILANTITAGKMDVSELAAITATLGAVEAGEIKASSYLALQEGADLYMMSNTLLADAAKIIFGASSDGTPANFVPDAYLYSWDNGSISGVFFEPATSGTSFLNIGSAPSKTNYKPFATVTICGKTAIDISASYSSTQPRGEFIATASSSAGHAHIYSGYDIGHQAYFNTDATSSTSYASANINGADVLTVSSAGVLISDVGSFSMAAAAKALESNSTGAQLRLSYTRGSVYTDFTVNSGGDLTIAPSGGDLNITGAANITKTTAQLTLSYDAGEYSTFTVGSTGNLTLAIATGTYFYINDANGYQIGSFYTAVSDAAEVLALGNSTYRGGLILFRKTSGTDYPGTVGFCPADSDSPVYLWADNDNNLKMSTTAPADGTGATDGYVLGPNRIQLVDSVSAPATASGRASIYITSGNTVSVKFGDGTVKTFNLT